MKSDRVLKEVQIFETTKHGVDWRISGRVKLVGHAVRFDPVYNPTDQTTYARMTMADGTVLQTKMRYDDEYALLSWIGEDQ